MSKEKEIDKIIKDKLQRHTSPLPSHLWEGVDAMLGKDKTGETDKLIKNKLQRHASPLPSHLWEGVDAMLDKDKMGNADKVIKDKLQMHASPTPTHLWKGIDAKLDDGKGKKRGFIWWWTGAAALLLLLGATWYFTTTKSDARKEKQTIDIKAGVAIQEKTIDSSSKTELQQTNNIQVSADLATAKQSTALNIEKTTTTAKSLLSPKNTSTAKSSAKKQDAQPTFVAPTAPKVVEDVIENSYPLELVKADETTEAKTPVVDAISDLSENKSALVGLELAAKSLLLDDSNKRILDLDKFINEDPECTCFQSKAAGKKDPKCARFGKWLKLYFYADAYVSPDIAFRTLSPKEMDFVEYSQTRDATESSGISFSTGARFSVVSNFGWAARTGIIYSQINERFDYESENHTRITIREIKNANGDIIDYDTLTEYGARYATIYNHYRMIDIPVIIGYEMNVKKMVVTLNSGVYLNLMSRQKGKFLSPDNKLVSFSSEDSDPYPAFKNRLNLSVYGSVGLLYNLNEHWQVMLEPHVRYYVDPLTKTDYMVEQKYFSTGLITGLRYKF